jgi:hypothetical protein
MWVGDQALATTRKPISPRIWVARGVRVLRDAAIAVALMTLIPIGIVAVRGGHLARAVYWPSRNVSARFSAIEPARAFGVSPDRSITPMQAGVVLNALQYRAHAVAGFDAIAPAARPALTWRDRPITPDMFASAQPDLFAAPSSRTVLEAVAKGFTPSEREYLRALAAAPVWRDFDLLAHAPAVDIVGGQFRIPFGANALPEQRPLPSYRETRELAAAAVSRAAYHMSLGQRDSAEAVLRSIISFGFMYVDNGTTTMDELVGTVIVNIGRDALHRFYLIEHDPRASVPALGSAWPAAAASSHLSGTSTAVEDGRHRLLARIQDPAVPRAERFDGLMALSVLPCTNVRELLLGPRSDAVAAAANVRRGVARYPSEQALVELQTRPLPASREYPTSGPAQSLLVSAASVAGAVLQNPRMAACTRLLTSGW